MDPEAFDVFIAPGSKALLFGLQLAIPGDLLLPVPSWVSYAPQAELINTRVIPVIASPSDAGLGLTAESVADAIHTARAKGLNPTKLLINFPSNPTGLTIDDVSLNALITVCKQEGVCLISDEIYGRLSYDGVYRSAGALWPEGAIVTTGLSKHLSLGGWRLGVTLIPKAMPQLVARLEQIGSEIWSCVAAPVQHAAIEAYGHHADIDDFVTHSTAIHRAVNREIANRLRAMGARCATPQGGFYTWPDFSEALAGRVATSDALSDELMTHCNLVTLPGSAFGDAPHHLTLRLSGCDYDGGHALAMTAGMDDDGIAAALPEFAPSVLQGLDKLDGFVRR